MNTAVRNIRITGQQTVIGVKGMGGNADVLRRGVDAGFHNEKAVAVTLRGESKLNDVSRLHFCNGNYRAFWPYSMPPGEKTVKIFHRCPRCCPVGGGDIIPTGVAGVVFRRTAGTNALGDEIAGLLNKPKKQKSRYLVIP